MPYEEEHFNDILFKFYRDVTIDLVRLHRRMQLRSEISRDYKSYLCRADEFRGVQSIKVNILYPINLKLMGNEPDSYQTFKSVRLLIFYPRWVMIGTYTITSADERKAKTTWSHNFNKTFDDHDIDYDMILARSYNVAYTDISRIIIKEDRSTLGRKVDAAVLLSNLKGMN